MRVPRFLCFAACGLGAALILGGCNEIVPKFELRDDYMGKRFLQPGKVAGEIARDAYGNPILPQQSAPAPRP